MSLANYSVMTNKGRINFGVPRQVQSDKSFTIVPYASLLVDCFHRAQTLGAGTCGSILVAIVVYSDSAGQELVMKLVVGKEEKEGPPTIWISGHQEKYSTSSTPPWKFHKKIVEMVDVKVPSSGKYKKQDGAGINKSSLCLTMPLYAEEEWSATMPLMREGSRINKKVPTMHHSLLSAVFTTMAWFSKTSRVIMS
jgi:hypothetical protein